MCLQVDPSDSPMTLAKDGLEMEKGLEATFKKWKKRWTKISMRNAYALIMKLDLILRVPKPHNQ